MGHRCKKCRHHAQSQKEKICRGRDHLFLVLCSVKTMPKGNGAIRELQVIGTSATLFRSLMYASVINHSLKSYLTESNCCMKHMAKTNTALHFPVSHVRVAKKDLSNKGRPASVVKKAVDAAGFIDSLPRRRKNWAASEQRGKQPPTIGLRNRRGVRYAQQSALPTDLSIKEEMLGYLE